MSGTRRTQLEDGLNCHPALIKEALELLFHCKTEQEHVDLIIEKNIMSSSQWRKYWKDNNLQEQNYITVCWRTFKKSAKEFFTEVKQQIQIKDILPI